MITLTAPEILSSLNLDAVENAILNDPETGKPQLLAHEFESAKSMVVAAMDKWLVSDLNTISASSLGLEERFDITLGGYPTRGYLDLRGQYKSGPNKGSVVVADWKSSSSDLDLTWQNRLVDSHQWRLYAVIPPGADFISYRGVNTKAKTREVYLSIQDLELLEDVTNYFSGVGDMIAALSTRDIWPMNKPSACGLFGSTCHRKNDCDNGTSPRYLIPAEEIQLSYSGVQRFLQCPEKWRRAKRDEAGLDSTDATRLGVSVHSGLEVIWREAFNKYGD